VNLRDTPEEGSFRAELRDWLEANLPAESHGHRGDRDWSRKLYEAGYAGLT